MVIDPILSRSALPNAQHSGEPSKGYRPDIDGLRAFAVTSVVAYHVGLQLFHGGYVGVDIFFVISGYLIGGHVYKDVRHNRFSIAAFYKRRAVRILPALFFVLICCFLMASFVLDAPEMQTFGEYAVATGASASNVLAWLKSGYFAAGADQNPLLMTWSLGVEEQFYVIFPLLMLLLARKGRRTLLLVAVAVTILSLGLSIVGLLKSPSATFYLLPTRAWELSVGIVLAVYETDRPVENLYAGGRFANLTGLLGMALLFFSVFVYTRDTPFPGLAAAVPVLGSALILISPRGWFNRYLLSSGPCVLLGLVSYSWYLWHWPLLSFARIAADRPISTLSACTIGLASLGIAWCSYRFVEQPFRKSTTPTVPLLRKYALLCALMMLPGLILVAMKGWPQRFPQLAVIERRSGMLQQKDKCLVQYGVATPDLSSYCVPKADPREGVALLGDSHAGALGEALRKMTAIQGLKFEEITKVSCPPLMKVTRLMPNHPGQDIECGSFNAEALDIVRSDPRIETVVLSGYWSAPFSEGSLYQRVGESMAATPSQSAENLGRGLADMVAALRSSGKHVIVLMDAPLFTFDPARRLRGSMIRVRGIMGRELMPSAHEVGSVSRYEVQSHYDDIASAIVEQAVGTSATIFNLKSNLCDAQTCAFYADNQLLYFDMQHLSEAGALRALRGMPLTVDTAQGNSASTFTCRLCFPTTRAISNNN
jgi:peptidoglycan/LPS O-acetylase OafA/YrhL